MDRQRIVVLGGTGFVGSSLCERLVKAGHEVRVLSRHRERHRELLVLPSAEVVEADVHNPVELRRQFQGMDVVVNLVGILNARGPAGREFERVHAELPAKVVQACRASGVKRLLHLSALHASPDGPSHYLRSKGQGEKIVREAECDKLHVSIFRPSVIFGPRDHFTNRFAALLRQVPGPFPLACATAQLQPVYINDVVEVLERALGLHASFGKQYNLCGPQVFTLYEIVSLLARQLGISKRILRLNRTLSFLQALLLQFVPGQPFTPDNFRSLQVANICDQPFPLLFGIQPTRLEAIVPTYLTAKN